MEVEPDQATPVLGPAEFGNLDNRDLYMEDPSQIPELWRRSADVTGIERTFKFKSFQAAWVSPFHLVITLLICRCLSNA